MRRQGTDLRLFDRKILIGLLIGTALLALILTFAYQTLEQVQISSARTRSTQEFRTQLNVISETLLNMETGQRGYLLTASREYREPYERSRRQLPEEIDRLRQLMTNNPAQRANVAAIVSLIDERQGQMAYALALHQAQGLPAAMEFVRTNQGHETMLQIRALLQRVSAEEARILARHEAEEATILQRNFWFSVSLSALVTALMIVIYTLVRRESAVRSRAEQQLAQTNASLEARVHESTQDLRRANASLQAQVEQRQRAEAELRREREMLEERVRERTVALAEASAVRTRFLSAASHDLRQPLQTLTLLNATLREQRLNPIAARIIETQQQTLGSMSQLVHALLDINRLESGSVQPDVRDFPLQELIAQLRTELTPLARARDLKIELDDCDASVRSDPTLLREILQNLLSNAIRYTERGEVRLRTRAIADGVRIDVADTGPGIPADKREIVFEEFQQLGGLGGPRREGFGLGLSIVRHAARALGLSVELESEVGIGTTFSLCIPFGEALPAKGSRAGGALDSREPLAGRILLIDDEAGVRNATELFLRMSGHEVDSSASPEEAFALLAAGPVPDFVISDYQLGSTLDGVQLVARIREQLNAVTPAVIMTGDTTRVARQSAHLQLCRIFHKPVDAQQLADHIQSVLAQRAAPSMGADIRMQG